MTLGLSVIVDSKPRFWCEYVLWTLCAERHASLPRRAYVIGHFPQSLAEFSRRRGVDLRRAETLIAQSPHCNKLIPFLDPEGFGDQIVTDTDLFLTGDIRQFFKVGEVRAAPNNHGNPPLRIFERLFKEAGFARSPEPGLALFAGRNGNRETYAGNISAGVVAIPDSLRGFALAWKARALWLLEKKELLGNFAHHVDQVAFALAVEETGVARSFLPPQANAVLELLPEIESLYGLHLTPAHIHRYPDWFAADKTLKAETVNPRLARPLESFNELLLAAVAEISICEEAKPFLEHFLNPAYRPAR